jgi:hypothetical protein
VAIERETQFKSSAGERARGHARVRLERARLQGRRERAASLQFVVSGVRVLLQVLEYEEGCESRACSTNACRERRDEVRVGGQARRGERTSASTRATRKSLQRPAARQQTRADRDGESSLASGSASRGEGGAFAGPCLSHIRTRLHSAMGNDEAISYNTRLCDGAAIVPRGGLSWFYKKSIECTSFSSRFNSRAYSNTAGRVRRSISIPVPRV